MLKILVGVVSVFPFVSLGLLGGDMQPFVFVVAVAYAILRRPSFLIMDKVYLIPLVTSVILALNWNMSDYQAVARALITYSAPFLLVNVYLNMSKLKRAGHINQRFSSEIVDVVFKSITYAAGVGALAQLMLGRDVLDTFLAVRTSDERGVTSFFNEPSMYGLSMCVCFCYFLIVRTEGWKYYSAALAFQIVFLSQSSVAVLVALLIVAMRIALFRPAFFVQVASVTAIMGVSVSGFFPEESRLVSVLAKIITAPSVLLEIDGSVNERFYHVFLSVGGAGIPMGYFSFSDAIAAEQSSNPNFWAGDPTVKIMSGMGAAFWELGLVGLLFVAYPACLGRQIGGWKEALFIAFSLVIIFVNSISFGHPYYSLLVAGLLLRANDLTPIFSATGR
jgi:hypothetical protein